MPSESPIQIIRNDNGQIWSHVRKIWLFETPEERVRQEYLCILVNEYGYKIDQIAEEENLTGRGSAQARADHVVWRSKEDKHAKNTPLMVVEYKSDNINISVMDYIQGELYARLCEAPFFVTHNHRETRYWRVRKDKVPGYLEEIESIPHANASEKDIAAILERLKVFREDEFADLLHRCHNIIRNREKKDPAAAFDEIAKILFIKTGVERRLKQGKQRKNLFTTELLEEQRTLHDDPINVLFQQTKSEYRADKIFQIDEKVNLKHDTASAIVKELERYNLSDTSEDIKGIAFERFLGRTFRGEIGQFFTPRPVVEFIVKMLEPREGQVVCDPASGSGGFLIRFFEIVRQQIYADIDRQYEEFKNTTDSRIDLDDATKASLLRDKYEELQRELDQNLEGSRMWKLANRSIYGTDANDRMARTSKMNMIMHGDGHGGVHHHDGFLNINGIFEGRFDVIFTNPPFGSNVEPTDRIREEDVDIPWDIERLYEQRYGEDYKQSRAKLKASIGKPIADLFELSKKDKGKLSKVKTEILFIERCLDLLKPGGQLGIVLPEGIFNNPSLAYVREFVEDRAKLLAVISLPAETFLSSGASVKCSLLFLQKFTSEENEKFNKILSQAKEEIKVKYQLVLEEKKKRVYDEIATAKANKDSERQKSLKREFLAYEKRINVLKSQETRQLLKQRFDYPVFLYDAEKVGLTATGEIDDNELYPNEHVPTDVEKTALELYEQFRIDPKPFFV
ncbi:N-6 DNA methylase [Brevibacillus fortis]|uniref:N-6 DNA methylase n=1 Tax=Brevibacillus fortis TaxID=2126352 RepID=A0A2P7UJV7_9BACL|nr:N-6 DNA methylase [Brevibacillus fortis]PSJ87248.1 N-6 DNA methylase [Brevibacillus fortis]